MRFWIGVTDTRWFDFLASSPRDEVNFWQPSGRAPFTTLPPGTPFLFKRKAPFNHIVGGGFFVRFVRVPLDLCWESFGVANGARTFAEFENLVRPLAREWHGPSTPIGCTLLTRPFFLPQHKWVRLPDGAWSPNIVSGKSLDSADVVGAAVWDAIEAARAPATTLNDPVEETSVETPAAYGDAFLARARLGQGTFRLLVTDAYSGRCAITGENVLPVLEAAHIKPFSVQGPHSAFNGLLLRSDFHKLFDRGLVTVTPERVVEVSPRIREEFFNGKAYYRLHGKKLAVVPDRVIDQPRADLLAWHNEHVFRSP